MIRLSNEIPSISLALSLHAPNQEVRLKIVPTASAYKIEKLMDAIDHHIKNNSNYLKNSRRDTEGSSFFTPRPSRLTCVMIEYILIKDLNDKESHAHELGKLLKPRRENVLLNLIPYNPTEVAEDYEPPTQASIDNFKGICTSSEYQIHTRVRQEKGQDIAGACGQLALVKVDKLKAHDIEDTGIVHKSSKAFVEGKNGHVRGSFGFTKPALLCGLNLLVPMLVVLYKALVRVDAPTVN